MTNLHEWEELNNNTRRLKVPGGWIYNIFPEQYGVYVPDDSIEVFGHHVQEAYKKGFKEGKQKGYDCKCEHEYKRGFRDALADNEKSQELPSTFYDDH